MNSRRNHCSVLLPALLPVLLVLCGMELCRAGEPGFSFRSGKVGYVSPDLSARHYFYPRHQEYKGDVWLVLELPEGLTPVGLNLRREAEPLPPAVFEEFEAVERKGKPFRRYEILIPPYWRQELFLYLDSTLKPGETTAYFYRAKTKKGEGRERRVPIEVISVHKVKHPPKRLVLGQAWESAGAFRAWPTSPSSICPWA